MGLLLLLKALFAFSNSILWLMFSTFYNIVFRTEWKFCDIFHWTVLMDYEAVMFSKKINVKHQPSNITHQIFLCWCLPVTTSSWLPFWNHQHWFHRKNHSWLQNSVHIFSELQTCKIRDFQFYWSMLKIMSTNSFFEVLGH